jgi:isoquinoline 1-oxidoreductase subunit beta
VQSKGRTGAGGGSAPSAVIRIDSTGKVVAKMPRLDVEEGARAPIRMMIAEELKVVPDRIDLEVAPPRQACGTGAMLDLLAACNVRVIRGVSHLLAELGATARAMLVAAAAEHWGVDAGSCHAHEGEVIHTPTRRKLSYGELAIDAALLPVPTEVALKAFEGEWQCLSSS